MKAFIKTTLVLSLSGLVLVALGSVSIWLSLAFLLIFAADIINIVVADYQRTQKRRIIAGLTAVADRTTSALRFGA